MPISFGTHGSKNGNGHSTTTTTTKHKNGTTTSISGTIPPPPGGWPPGVAAAGPDEDDDTGANRIDTDATILSVYSLFCMILLLLLVKWILSLLPTTMPILGTLVCSIYYHMGIILLSTMPLLLPVMMTMAIRILAGPI